MSYLDSQIASVENSIRAVKAGISSAQYMLNNDITPDHQKDAARTELSNLQYQLSWYQGELQRLEGEKQEEERRRQEEQDE